MENTEFGTPLTIPYRHPLNEFIELWVLPEFIDDEDIHIVKAHAFQYFGPDEWYLDLQLPSGSYRLIGADFMNSDEGEHGITSLLRESGVKNIDDYRPVLTVNVDNNYITEVILPDDQKHLIPEDKFFHGWGGVAINHSTQRKLPYQYYPIITDYYCLLKQTY